MWKRGWANWSPDVCLRYLSVDASFRRSLHGLSKTEIREWFPDLRIEMKPEQYLDRSQPFYISSSDFLWIGASQLAIEFHDGKVTKFALIKGEPQEETRRAFSQGVQAEGFSS